jgi:hypothetical protein
MNHKSKKEKDIQRICECQRGLQLTTVHELMLKKTVISLVVLVKEETTGSNSSR